MVGLNEYCKCKDRRKRAINMSLSLRRWKTLSNELSGVNDTSKVEAGSS